MNRSLLKSLNDGELPERIDDYLEGGKAVDMCFNRHGNILASGTAEGQVVLWDFDTKSIAKKLEGHEQLVTSVAFPAPGTGQRLISGSLDGTLRLWDVLKGTCTKWKVGAKVCFVAVSPKEPNICAVVPVGEVPRIIMWRNDDIGDITAEHKLDHAEDEKPDSKKKLEFVVAFNEKGTQVVRGGSSGILRSFTCLRVGENGDRLQVEPMLKAELPNRAAVKEIVFAKDGSRLLVNSQDRYIRVYDAENLCVMANFTDVVNRSQWRCAIFSGNGNYILGGSTGAEHKLHIWRLTDSQLEKTLEGPKEGIGGLLWHPRRPIAVSLGVSSGLVYVWKKNQTENWSAFAPNFMEIEENEEYDEREDEFDLPNPEVEQRKLQEKLGREALRFVDVVTVEKGEDSEDMEPFYLPAIPEPNEVPIIPTGSLQPVERKPKAKTAKHIQRKRKRTGGTTKKVVAGYKDGFDNQQGLGSTNETFTTTRHVGDGNGNK